MSKDYRIISNGSRLPYSCENARFMTNIEKGNTHNPRSQTKGNVLEVPLLNDDEASLWLEHVIDKNTDEELYWLMWYNTSGFPLITMSSVFNKTQLESMVGNLTRFVP